MEKYVREGLIRSQYELPSRLNYLARYYDISWYDALRLYEICVEEVLIISGAENIIDEPLTFGRGYGLAKQLFKEKLDKNFKKVERK